jgi:hypothetical protein
LQPWTQTCAAGTMECVLFEVASRLTRDARPHPEERACRRRSANSNARRRVSKDEGVRLSFALMLRDASQLREPMEAPMLARRCDAPQHEGERARCILAKRSQRVRRDRYGLLQDEPVVAGSDRRRHSIVSGLLFTMDGATSTCGAPSARAPPECWQPSRAGARVPCLASLRRELPHVLPCKGNYDHDHSRQQAQLCPEVGQAAAFCDVALDCHGDDLPFGRHL